MLKHRDQAFHWQKNHAAFEKSRLLYTIKAVKNFLLLSASISLKRRYSSFTKSTETLTFVSNVIKHFVQQAHSVSTKEHADITQHTNKEYHLWLEIEREVGAWS